MDSFAIGDLFFRLAEVPLLYPALQHSSLDWEFETVPSDRYCLAMDGVCSFPRGKVLGGSSVIYSRHFCCWKKQCFFLNMCS